MPKLSEDVLITAYIAPSPRERRGVPAKTLIRRKDNVDRCEGVEGVCSSSLPLIRRQITFSKCFELTSW